MSSVLFSKPRVLFLKPKGGENIEPGAKMSSVLFSKPKIRLKQKGFLLSQTNLFFNLGFDFKTFFSLFKTQTFKSLIVKNHRFYFQNQKLFLKPKAGKNKNLWLV